MHVLNFVPNLNSLCEILFSRFCLIREVPSNGDTADTYSLLFSAFPVRQSSYIASYTSHIVLSIELSIEQEKIIEVIVLCHTDNIIQYQCTSLDPLLGVWQGVRVRMFMHYQLSARAYFTFLKLSGTQSDSSPGTYMYMYLHITHMYVYMCTCIQAYMYIYMYCTVCRMLWFQALPDASLLHLSFI